MYECNILLMAIIGANTHESGGKVLAAGGVSSMRGPGNIFN